MTCRSTRRSRRSDWPGGAHRCSGGDEPARRVGNGETRPEIRKAGMGIVVEYANQQGPPRWIDPPETLWDYTLFAKQEPTATEPDQQIPLVFESKFRGHGEFDYWTDQWQVVSEDGRSSIERRQALQISDAQQKQRRSSHSTCIAIPSRLRAGCKPMSGLRKDVVVVKANSNARD